MNITRLPLPHDSVIELVEELLDRARSGQLKFFVALAATKDGELLTAYSGDRSAAQPFAMAGFLESLKLNILVLHDDELRYRVREAAENADLPG